MQEHLKRPLRDDEVVHHINGDKTDNRVENLAVMSQSEHAQIHFRRKRVHRWSKEYDQCIECGGKDRRHMGHGLCATCYNRAYYIAHTA